MHTKSRYIMVGILTLTLCFMECSSPYRRSILGGIIGASSGGVIGGAIGKAAGNTAVGAIIGAAVGGAAGTAIGHYMDRQAAEIRRDISNAKVERVGEGIKITFNSGILFDVGASNLRPAAQANTSQLAKILIKYKDTNILIEGHTDSTGSEKMNIALSEDRASSVSRRLKSQGVVGGRITTVGYGENQPIANNGSVAGRQENRRVEVAIFANEKLKRAAKENKQI
jgi:outer membrane protein OmpA-like peptidoglycan-associated protein